MSYSHTRTTTTLPVEADTTYLKLKQFDYQVFFHKKQGFCCSVLVHWSIETALMQEKNIRTN